MKVINKPKFELSDEIKIQIVESLSINGLSLKIRELRQFYANFLAANERGDSYEVSLQQALDNLRTRRMLLELEKFEPNDCY